MVYCLYPETNQRTLEDMDLLFAADTPWVWDAERRFAELKAEQTENEGHTKLEEGKLASDEESIKGRAKGLETETERVEERSQ